MFVELDLRVVEGKIEKILFDEKLQQLTLVVNKVNYKVFLNSSFYFDVGDTVKIVFHGKYDEIDAVLNLDNGCLYLNDLIYQVNPRYLKDQLKKVAFYTFWIILIFIIELVLYQFVMDNTVYYFDIFQYVLIILIASILFVGYYILRNWDKTEHKFSKKVFELLELPDLEQNQLKYLRMTNSYFEVVQYLYDMKQVLKIIQKNNLLNSKALIDKICRTRSSENLTEFQEIKFKLQLQKGKIKQLKKERIPVSYHDDDPFIEVTATLNGLPIYGYFDEFFIKNDQEVTTVISTFSDERGYYIWGLYDGKKYLYLDEDQPVCKSEKHTKDKAILSFIASSVVIAGIALVFGFMIDFAFFFYVYLAVMAYILIYQTAKVFYHRYLDHESKVGFYVFQQLSQYLRLPSSFIWSDSMIHKLSRHGDDENKSRTGYDINKLGN